MNNFEKYFGNIDKAVETLLSLEETCNFCICKDKDCHIHYIDGCRNNIKESLKQQVKTKKVRNCDLYKTPEELLSAFLKHCDSTDCGACKYQSINMNCGFNFAYGYTEVEDE